MKIKALWIILLCSISLSACSRMFPKKLDTLKDLSRPSAPSLIIQERPYPYQETEYRTFVSTAINRNEIQEVPIVELQNKKQTKNLWRDQNEETRILFSGMRRPDADRPCAVDPRISVCDGNPGSRHVWLRYL